MDIPSLNPYKPKGGLNSFTLSSRDPIVGISFDGIARDISIYGFDKMEIQRIQYVHLPTMPMNLAFVPTIVIRSEFMKFRFHSITFCRDFGPNCENTKVKMTIRVPTFTFYSDDVTAKIKLLTLPMISANFAINSTASKHVQANN